VKGRIKALFIALFSGVFFLANMFALSACSGKKSSSSDNHEHVYVGGICTICGADNDGTTQHIGPTYTRCDVNGTADPAGGYILFGSYPQTKVKDEDLISSLNSAAGTLPTSDNSQGWTSYKYYIEYDNSTDYMWYIDVTYSGSTYRGVYFTSYRPYRCSDSSFTDNSNQDENGYYTNTAYWFEYESILWRILSEDGSTALILSETRIDSQQYHWENTTSTVSRSAVDNYDDSYYAGGGTASTESACTNNYKYSDIRAWLNETFYNTAFGTTEKSLIKTTTVDNSAASTTDYSGNLTKATSYYCDNTNDKVFLLSEYEATNTAYGFSSYDIYDAARQKNPSDYAASQGCWALTISSNLGCGSWWLRSPYDNDANYSRIIFYSGFANYNSNVHITSYGVLPALQISLK